MSRETWAVEHAFATLEELQKAVDSLPRAGDPEQIRQLVNRTEAALETLKRHHSDPHSQELDAEAILDARRPSNGRRHLRLV